MKYAKIIIILILLIALFGFGKVSSANASYLNFTGFETGNALEMNSLTGTASIQNTTKRTGSYALRTNPTTSAIGYVVVGQPCANGQVTSTCLFNLATTYVSFYFRYATKPASASERIFGGNVSAATGKFRINLNSNGTIGVYDTSNVLQGTGSTVLSANTWYYFNVKVGTGTAPYEVKINGNTELSGTISQNASNLGEVWLGKTTNQNSNTVDYYFDDVVVSDTGYAPDNEQVNILKPNGSGSTSSWTNTAGTVPTNVADIPHDSDTSYISSTTNGQITTVNLDSADTGSVLAGIGSVKNIGIVRDNGGASSFGIRLKSGGGNCDTTAGDPAASYIALAKINNSDCSGAGAWTRSQLDVIEAGVFNSANVEARATGLYAMTLSYPTTPTVTTNAATSITSTTATINSTVNPNGLQTNLFYWYSTSPGGCTAQTFYGDLGSGLSDVTPSARGLTGLTQGTTYYYCAYAANILGNTAGSQQSFTTLLSTPTIISPTQTAKTYNSITLGGNITAQGGSTVGARGVCRSTGDSTPTIAEGATCTSMGSGTGLFSGSVSGLSPNTFYYYAAYATNSQGTSYTSTDSFTTDSDLPLSTDTSTAQSVNSYYVTLRGTANPNSFQTYGHFRVFTANPGNCNTDGGGSRFPELQANDVNVGSSTSSTPFQFTVPFNGSSFVVPNTDYWYCAYAVGTNGTGGASTVQTFSTPDGPASPCDPPTSGNLSMPSGAVCSFTGNFSGVDQGTGTTNTGTIAIAAGGGRLVVGPSQRIARGSITKPQGSKISMAQGAVIVKGGAYVHDKDGDGIIDDKTQYVGSTASAAIEFVRRNSIAATYNYAAKIASAAASTDCDPNSAYVNRYVPGVQMVTDADNDGYKTSAAASNACVGTQSTINGRTYYKDSSNVSSWLPDGQKLSATTDCQDNPNGTPCAPSSVSASNPSSQTQNNVTFSGTQTGGAVPAGTGFDLKWCTGGSCSPSATLTSVTSIYNHSFSANPSTIYGYAVAAKNAAGTGTYSTPTQYTTTAASCTNTTVYVDSDGDGHGAVISRGVTNSNSLDAASSIAVTKPSDVVNGSFMLAVISYSKNSGGGSTGVTVTPPSGWTLIGTTRDATNLQAVEMYYKVAGGSEGASYTWSFSSASDTNAVVATYNNVNTASPIDVSTTYLNNSASTTVTFPSITTTVQNDMVVGAIDSWQASNFYTSISGWEKYKDITVSGADTMAVWQKSYASTGATGAQSSTYPVSTQWSSMTVALKPLTQPTTQCITGSPSAGWSVDSTDCNDGSNTKWQMTSGEPDADGDGYGDDNYGTTLVASSAKTAGTAADVGGGSFSWTNTTNAQGSSDSSTADSSTLNPNAVSNTLRLTNFGFSVPSNATITGVKATVYARGNTDSSGNIIDNWNTIKLYKSGTLSSNKSDGKAVGPNAWSMNRKFYGSATDLWGLSLAPSDVNSSTFGINIAWSCASSCNFFGNGAGALSVDASTIEVFYTVPSGVSESVCSGSSIATGWTTSAATDCYDGSANAHPGQTSYFSSNRGDGSYDYNCDGESVQQYSDAYASGGVLTAASPGNTYYKIGGVCTNVTTNAQFTSPYNYQGYWDHYAGSAECGNSGTGNASFVDYGSGNNTCTGNGLGLPSVVPNAGVDLVTVTGSLSCR